MQPSISTCNGGGVDGETAIDKCRQNIARWRPMQDRVAPRDAQGARALDIGSDCRRVRAAGMSSEPEMVRHVIVAERSYMTTSADLPGLQRCGTAWPEADRGSSSQQACTSISAQSTHLGANCTHIGKSPFGYSSWIHDRHSAWLLYALPCRSIHPNDLIDTPEA